METPEGHLRIGELSQRTGVSPELLRAWERRYGLLKPSRSSGGFRLYSEADEARIRRMRSHLARGVAAAEAARLAARAEAAEVSTGSLADMKEALATSLERYDEAGGQRVLDEALATFTIDTVISDLLVPYLRELGDRWASGEVTVAQEHFASQLIRTRVLSLARSWDAGTGPRALLACPEGELHDLGMALFAVALARRGWRITFLGAHTPLATVAATAERLDPDIIVIAISDPAHMSGSGDGLAALAGGHRVILAGPGAASVSVSGVETLNLDPVESARVVAEG